MQRSFPRPFRRTRRPSDSVQFEKRANIPSNQRRFWCGRRTGLALPSWEDGVVLIGEKIEAVLREHLGHPMSLAELQAAIPGSTRRKLTAACMQLREQGRLGRNGANTQSSPYRFYLKNFGNI